MKILGDERSFLQVLSDPEKRKIYDQFGEEGLKGGMGGMGGGGMPGGMNGGGAQFRSMEEVLKEVCVSNLCANHDIMSLYATATSFALKQ